MHLSLKKLDVYVEISLISCRNVNHRFFGVHKLYRTSVNSVQLNIFSISFLVRLNTCNKNPRSSASALNRPRLLVIST